LLAVADKNHNFVNMRITKIHLQNFKRFTDLTIDQIPAEAKLVLLIGANGSGKSSVFDALDYLNKIIFRYQNYTEHDYYDKNGKELNIEIEFDNQKVLSVNSTKGIKGETGYAKKFIGRSSIRIVPRISNEANPERVLDNQDAPRTLIDPDIRFTNDLFMYMQSIDNALREPIFSGRSADTLQIFQQSIEPLNTSLLNIFGGTNETTIQIAEYQNATPYSAGKLLFRKGSSKINYDLLSHGEKQVVILLINFIVRKQYYDDALIFIDEMDCHLNTALQSRLLEEIVTVWIPNNAQLWTATHALGFIDYARKSEQATIIDFDLLNFDVPQTIVPEPKENIDVYDIAIPKAMMFEILKDKKLVVCENKNDEYYNLLQIPDTIFVGVKDARDVFLNVKRDSRYHSLRDRDFLTDAEIDRLKRIYPHHHILKYYDFENYIYHPNNLEELNIKGFDRATYIKDITDQKNEQIYYILPVLASSRQTYEEFKTDEKFKEKEPMQIIEDLRSNEFERFYKYFDMKTKFNKTAWANLLPNKETLVQTNWFRQQIENILKS
jgi:hypothetical protein